VNTNLNQLECSTDALQVTLGGNGCPDGR